MSDLNAHADRLVSQNVHLCLSSMIATLASGYGHCSARTRDFPHEGLMEQAFGLCTPGEDYEEAARQAGFVQSDADHGAIGKPADIDADDFDATFDSWQEACEANDIEPYTWEVFEHWAVSTWLAEKLAEAGERVDTDFAGLNVWARTTTGQAISMDSVIQKIAADLHA